MKIAVDCRMISNSGIGAYLENILNNLILHEELDFLLVGSISKLSKYSGKRNCRILPVDISIFSLKELLFFPVKEINECACFYSPNYNIPLGIKIPIISTIHDVLFLDNSHVGSKVKKYINYAYLQQAFIRSKIVFTVSEFSRSRIIHYFRHPSKIKVTYNGISGSFLNPGLLLPYFNFPYFLFVGNIKPHKGLRYLLEAYTSLERSGIAQKLVIVGNKENFKSSDVYIKTMIERGTLSNNVVFTGYIPSIDLVRIMKYADLLIQPSEYEGFGIPPLESMYLGTPVLLSDIPVFREIYKEFPVEYFKSCNADDLALKMRNNSYERICLSDQLKMKYNYQRSTQIVLNCILQNGKI